MHPPLFAMALPISILVWASVLGLLRARQNRRQLHSSLTALEQRIDRLLDRASIRFDLYANLPTGIREAMQRNQPIQAIKIYRQATGVGLKQAKDFIDGLASEEQRLARKLDALLQQPAGRS